MITCAARLVVAAFLLLSGVACSEPELTITRAVLAGDQIFVEIHAYTYFKPIYSHTPETIHSRYYVMRFPMARVAAASQPMVVASMPWPGMLEASYSSNRLLLAEPPTFWFEHNDWGIVLMQWTNLHCPTRLWSWNWDPSRAKLPPFAMSNDGRYLVLSEAVPRVLDTETLKWIIEPRISDALRKARELDPDPKQVFRFTQQLSYLVFAPAQLSRSGSKVFSAGGGQYLRKGYSAFIERRTGRIGAFSNQLNGGVASAAPGNLYQEAAESADGKLLLLYGKAALQGDGTLFSICDERLAIRHEILVRSSSVSDGETLAIGRSWDPDRHCILFFNDVDLGHCPGPCRFEVWDYEAGTTRTFWVDVAGSFLKGEGGFSPRISCEQSGGKTRTGAFF